MKKQIASDISDLMVSFGGELNQSVGDIKNQCTEEEFKSYRTAISKIMGIMLLDIMNPIFDEYPDLKPKELE